LDTSHFLHPLGPLAQCTPSMTLMMSSHSPESLVMSKMSHFPI
jgi:hypothetical protein